MKSSQKCLHSFLQSMPKQRVPISVLYNMYLSIMYSVPKKPAHCEECTAAISYKSWFFSPSFQGPLKATWKYILAASNAIQSNLVTRNGFVRYILGFDHQALGKPKY